jgi:hypothetical protein
LDITERALFTIKIMCCCYRICAEAGNVCVWAQMWLQSVKCTDICCLPFYMISCHLPIVLLCNQSSFCSASPSPLGLPVHEEQRHCEKGCAELKPRPPKGGSCWPSEGGSLSLPTVQG